MLKLGNSMKLLQMLKNVSLLILTGPGDINVRELLYKIFVNLEKQLKRLKKGWN